MNIFRENDIVRLRSGVRAKIVSGTEVFIPEGSEGTVVVYGNSDQPSAYEVEFFILEQNDFALATVDESLVSEI